MDFEPKTEEEVKSNFDLLPDGSIYDFDVLKAVDKTSKQGNDMIEINIGLYIDGKVKNRIFDYLLPSMEAKLRHFCDTVGLLSEYEAGSLEAYLCEGRSGTVKIGIQAAKGQFSAKNIVKDYICRAAKPLASGKSEPVPEEHTEEEPF